MRHPKFQNTINIMIFVCVQNNKLPFNGRQSEWLIIGKCMANAFYLVFQQIIADLP